MISADGYDRLTEQLTQAVIARDGIAGLVLLGSASSAGRHRRDEWSDHDFFAVAEAGRGGEARQSVDWLPDPHRLVLLIRETDIGFVALYDDGHVLEFALAEPSELAGILAGDATVAVDDADATTSRLIAGGHDQALAADRFDPERDTGLVLVKLLIGVGRVRRGEVLNGGQFIRIWAVNHLLRAIRGRFSENTTGSRDIIDPTRRFERDYPAWADRIVLALDQRPELAAHRLFTLTREILEPGWDAFPARAADAVAHRLGWDT